MKQKYLLSMLLGGAMLTACSVEDDFNLAPVAQESSAPVFNVSLNAGEDDMTRADWVAAGWKVKFEPTDQLSLYHGMNTTDGLAGGNWQNAIYAGGTTADGVDGGAFTFTTQSMVMPGHAVMVYPADTSLGEVGDNSLGNGAPKIKIDKDQNADYKKKTPYMSEVLNIVKSPGNDATKVAGGYGVTYDIELRRVAGILEMTLNSKNVTLVPGVDLKIKKVEMSDENDVFTNVAPIKEKTRQINENSDHKTWVAFSELDYANATGVSRITTTDLTNEVLTGDQASVATFTLLPKPTNVSLSENSELVVRTTYGKVVVHAGDEVWGEDGDKTTSETFEAILKDGTMCANATSGTFKGEPVGQHRTIGVKIDMKNLSMDGLHIANNDELDAALTVYEKIGGSLETDKNKEITWILDGTNKTFTMEQAVWKRLETQLNKNGNKLHIALCSEEAVCNTVVLKGTEAEVPALKFETKNGDSFSDASIAVNLNGSWTYNSSEKGNSDTRKAIKGVKTLTVLSGSTLTLRNYITAQNTGMKIVNKGTTIVDGTVTLELDMDNQGTLTIGKNNSLSLKDEPNGATRGVTLENCAVAQNNNNTKTGFSNFDEGGVINVGGMLAINDNLNGPSKSVINNYGTINQTEETAYILITSNKKDDAEIDKLYNQNNNNNVIGTIWLYNAKGGKNVNVKNIKASTTTKDHKGFIKIKVEKTDEVVDNFGDLANYVIVSGSCAGIKYAEKSSAATNLPTQVEYIEINNNNGTEVLMDGDFTKVSLKGLIVRTGKNVRITSGSKVTLTTAVLAQGLIIYSGEFNYPNEDDGDFCNYFGGSTGDVNNIKSFGGTSTNNN